MWPASASSAIELIHSAVDQFEDEERRQDRRGDEHPADAGVTAVL